MSAIILPDEVFGRLRPERPPSAVDADPIGLRSVESLNVASFHQARVG
jgi:hypothetical protein